MKLSYSKCKLFSGLYALNKMVTKVWKIWNSLRSQRILVWKFYRMLYFHLVWYTKQIFVLPHICFCCRYLKTKKPALPYKKPQIFDKLLTVLLPLMLPFAEAAVRRCFTKKMFLKILQKHKKTYVPGSCFNNVAVLQIETPMQMFSWKLCKIFKNTYFIEHPRATASAFWRSNNQNRCKRILHYTNVSLDTVNIYIYYKWL